METMISLLQKFKPFLLLLITIFLPNFGLITSRQPSWLFCLGENNTLPSYQSNVQSLMDSLSSESSFNTFYNDSFNGIYGLFLCRGDVNRSTCKTCVQEATQFLPQECFSYEGAVIWYEKCLLRYSDTNFIGEMSYLPNYLIWNLRNTTSPGEVNYGVLGLIYTMIDQAANAQMLYDAQEKEVPSNGSRHRYALVQCSRDLNKSSCTSCLGLIANRIQECCQGRAGWWLLM